MDVETFWDALSDDVLKAEGAVLAHATKKEPVAWSKVKLDQFYCLRSVHR